MSLILGLILVFSGQILLVQSGCNGIDDNLCKCQPLYEVPTWMNISEVESSQSIATGVVADDCSSLVIHEKVTFDTVNNLRVLFLKARAMDQYLIIAGSSFNGTSRRHLKDYHWRLAKIGNVTIKTGAFENVLVNLHIYDVDQLVIEEGAFVKCRGSITLHNVNAYIARKAAISSSMTVIRTGLANHTKIGLPNEKLESTSLAYNQFERRHKSEEEVSPSVSLLRNITLGGVVALLSVSVFLLLMTVVIIVTMEKLYRHSYERLGGRNASHDVQRPNQSAPNLPLRPPPQAPTAGGFNGRHRY